MVQAQRVSAEISASLPKESSVIIDANVDAGDDAAGDASSGGGAEPEGT